MKPTNVSRDYLTNCYVREGIHPFLKRMEDEYLTNKKPFSVLIMDVDHFKSFNDKYGHMYGDEVLKYFSSSLRLDLEDEENVPFRFGGDEFVMVFPGKTAENALELAGRLKKNIHSRSCLIKGRQISITFSGGIAAYPADANNIDDIMEKADKALYYSKNHGRNCITRYSDVAQKELLQVTLVVAFLAIVGSLVYFYRDTLAEKTNNFSGWASAVIRKPEPAQPVPPDPSATTQPAPVVSGDGKSEGETSEEEAAMCEILLESGRMIKGKITHEDEDVYEVEIQLTEGTGMLQIKKSQVVRVKKIPKSA